MGTAADVVRYVWPQADIEGIISKLKTVCGIVASFNVLMQLFHKISQDLNKNIPGYITKIERSLKIKLAFKGMIILWIAKGNWGLITLFVMIIPQLDKQSLW